MAFGAARAFKEGFSWTLINLNNPINIIIIPIGGGFHNLKELMRELDRLTDPFKHQLSFNVPNYSLVKRGCTEVVPSYNTHRWMYNINQNNIQQEKIISDLYHTIAPTQNYYQDILDSFKIHHYEKKKSILQERPLKIAKVQEKQINKVIKQEIVKEAPKVPLVRSPSFKLTEYKTKKGESKYLIVRNKVKNNDEENSEDILSDWLSTTEGRNKTRKPRTHKISHRSMRKEIIKKAEDEMNGPLTYSDMLKKNLKLKKTFDPVEDIFEAFRDYLKELDGYVEEPEEIRQIKPEKIREIKPEKIREIKPDYYIPPPPPMPPSLLAHETVESGQPTVKVAYNVRKRMGTPWNKIGKKHAKKERRIKKLIGFKTEEVKIIKGSKQKDEAISLIKRPRKYAVESIFGNWRHNFIETDEGRKPDYTVEGYFGNWRRNLYEKSINTNIVENKPKVLQPESLFSDWVHNMMDKEDYLDLKRTNSKRQSRKKKGGNNNANSEPQQYLKNKKMMMEDEIPSFKEDHHQIKKRNSKNHRKQKVE